MIIDFHTHIFPPEVKGNLDRYFGEDQCLVELYSGGKAKIVTADELIDSMDAEGVDISVVLNLGWTSHELCVETNDYIIEAVARYPGRLVGFGAVQPRFMELAIQEVERCAQAGLRGIGEMRPDLQGFNMADKQAMQPLADALIKHNLIFLLHASEPVGHMYQGKGRITPDTFYPFITSFPDITVVCAHWGGGLPFYALMPEVRKYLRNVYFDTAASPYLYNPQIYREAANIIGVEKILFGSDYPLLPPSRYLKEIDAADLSIEEKERILAGNARGILGIRESV